jgi:hypothetical protein
LKYLKQTCIYYIVDSFFNINKPLSGDNSAILYLFIYFYILIVKYLTTYLNQYLNQSKGRDEIAGNIRLNF